MIFLIVLQCSRDRFSNFAWVAILREITIFNDGVNVEFVLSFSRVFQKVDNEFEETVKCHHFLSADVKKKTNVNKIQ